jgi:hypothetical protein
VLLSPPTESEQGRAVEPTSIASQIEQAPQGGVVRVPAGVHPVDRPIVRDGPISILGEGKGISRLAFMSAGGIRIRLHGNNNQPVNIQDLTLSATVQNAATALLLDYPYTEGVEGGLSSYPSAHIEDVAFLPDAAHPSAFWNGGLQLVNARHAKVVRVYYKGKGGSPPPQNTFGIRLTNATTDAFILNPQVYNAHRAIYCDEYSSTGGGAGHQAEGIHIVHPNLVEVIRGIEMITARREAGVYITKGHISAHEYGILLENRFHATIEGTLIFRDANSTVPYVGIRIKGEPGGASSYNNNIYGVHIRGQAAASGGATKGMVISETERANIFGNNIWFPEGDTTGVGITLAASTRSCLVHGNIRARGVKTVVDQAILTGNRVSNNLPA